MLSRMRPLVGWSAVVLLTIMLLTVAWSIQAAGWVAGLQVLSFAVVGGVVVGLVLARLEWMPSVLAHSWAIVLGFVWTVFLGTVALPAYLPEEALVDLQLTARMAAVRDTVALWLATVRTTGAAQESGFVFVLAACFLLWLLSYVCVRFLVKYVSFWGATLPAGFALAANLYYSKQPSPTYLALFLLCALLLAVRTSVTLNEDYWRRARIPYSPDIGLDFLKDGVVVAVAVLALGWLAPSDVRSAQLGTVVSAVTQSSQTVSSQLNKWFPDLNYPTRGSGGAYSDSMPLTGSISLGVMPIFDVRVDGDVVPRYFRMATFDTYDGTGWSRSPQETVKIADAPVSVPARDTVPVTQTVQTLQAATTQLFAAPQPGAFSLPVEVTMGAGGAEDILSVQPSEPLMVGATYGVVSDVSQASLASLRAAGTDDPGWVTERYLQMPSSPALDRVAGLARDLTKDHDNRYDQADAIENYLRAIPYSETIDTPPEGQDRVAWFLFDERRGYCDYYSSAFVAMARSVGIPARVAAGYSLGDANAASGAYREHAFDAHSWPEVYFPEYGWIEFEPTGNDPEIARPAGEAGAEATVNASAPERQDMLPPDEPIAAPEASGAAAATAGGRRVGRLLGWLAAALLGCVAVAAAARFAWDRPLRGLSPTESAFARVVRVASWAGLRPRIADTPFEYGRRLSDAVPEARAPLDEITSAYVEARFAPRPGADAAEPAHLAAAWRHVRGALVHFGAGRGLRRFVRRG